MITSQVIEIPVEFLSRFEADPITAWQSFGDTPQESEFPYFENRQAIYNMVDRDRVNPIDEKGHISPDFYCNDDFYRFMHVDIGVKKDACALAMCHVSEWIKVKVKDVDGSGNPIYTTDIRPIFEVDAMARLVPDQPGDEVIIEDVRRIIYELDERGFPLLLITFDRFQSVDTMQILRRGTETSPGFIVGNLSLDKTSTYPVVDASKKDRIRKETTGGGKFATMAAWSHGKTVINNGRLHCPTFLPITNTQVQHLGTIIGDVDDFGQRIESTQFLTHIEREALSATYDQKLLKVTESPKSTIDLLEAVVGCIYNAHNNVVSPPDAPETEQRKRQRLKQQSQTARTVFDKESTQHSPQTDERDDFDDRTTERQDFFFGDDDESFDKQDFFY